jgi:hypothetical protein
MRRIRKSADFAERSRHLCPQVSDCMQCPRLRFSSVELLAIKRNKIAHCQTSKGG